VRHECCLEAERPGWRLSSRSHTAAWVVEESLCWNVSPAQKARRPEILVAVLGPALEPVVLASVAGELVPDGVDDCSGCRTAVARLRREQQQELVLPAVVQRRELVQAAVVPGAACWRHRATGWQGPPRRDRRRRRQKHAMQAQQGHASSERLG
jgi:hypothetical protein